jgi:hypothetical protein
VKESLSQDDSSANSSDPDLARFYFCEFRRKEFFNSHSLHSQPNWVADFERITGQPEVSSLEASVTDFRAALWFCPEPVMQRIQFQIDPTRDRCLACPQKNPDCGTSKPLQLP